MPTFKVVQHRDAIIHFETEVDAATPEAALEHAKSCDCAWVETSHDTLDHAEMEVQDLKGATLVPSRDVW